MPPDEVLITTYRQTAASVDRILMDAVLLSLFLAQLPAQYQTADPGMVAQRLVYLRKRGRLPRLFRNRSKHG
jgi:hypothetical protein